MSQRLESMGRGQAERLMPLLTEMLEEEGFGWRDLAGVGVGTGPGNFTGLRIAVSAARGLALGLGRPAIGISGFEAAAEGLARPVTVALPAPGGDAYVQTLDSGVPQLVAREAVPPGALGPLAAADLAPTIARLALARLGPPGPRPAPLYVRGPDAAPPRHPSPAHLP